MAKKSDKIQQVTISDKIRVAQLSTLEDILAAGGGGGGGDSSAANQLTQIARADAIITALGLLGTEVTVASILAALGVQATEGKQDDIITAIGAIPGGGDVAEETAFVTIAPLVAGGVFNSGMLDASGKTQVQTEINSNKDGTIEIEFCEDAAGTNIIRSLSIPYVAADGYQFFAAPAFVNFIRYKFTNTSVDTNTIYYTTKFLTTGLSPQLLTTNAFIASAMVATLSRSILTGQDSSGAFKNVSVVETTNAAGTTQNLQVVSGARPSQLAGRTPVLIDIDLVSTSSTGYTVTALKTLYITDAVLSFENTATNDPVQGALEDGSGGDVKMRFIAPEAANSTTTTTEYSHSFAEPISFATEVYIEIATGGGIGDGILSGTLIGYEE